MHAVIVFLIISKNKNLPTDKMTIIMTDLVEYNDINLDILYTYG